MPSRTNLPPAIPLFLNGTKLGQQHRNLNPKTSCEGPAGTGDAILNPVRTTWSKIVGVKSQIQHKSPSVSTSAASITGLFRTTLASPPAIFGRHNAAVGVNKAHALQLI